MNIQPLTVPATPKSPKNFSIEFDEVTFRYNETSKNALDGINLRINQGDHIALVGASGGGKTTLASMIARFWDAASGKVSIGGVDVKELSEKELMNTVSFVFQDSKLLKASVLENVRMAKKNATREEVVQALHDAQCDDILEKLPNGMDTVIGAKGNYLSGAEQPRLSIAKVMLRNDPINK